MRIPAIWNEPGGPEGGREGFILSGTEDGSLWFEYEVNKVVHRRTILAEHAEFSSNIWAGVSPSYLTDRDSITWLYRQTILDLLSCLDEAYNIRSLSKAQVAHHKAVQERAKLLTCESKNSLYRLLYDSHL